MSKPEEVNTTALLAEALTGKKMVVLPRVENGSLILHKITSVTDLVRGSYELLEPKKSCKIISKNSVDLFYCAGIAFDRKGNRLGWGKGYYDKLLARRNRTPKSVWRTHFKFLQKCPVHRMMFR